MRVFFVASEMAPFSKTGGLGDVTAALPAILRALGTDIRILVPLYPDRPRMEDLRKLCTVHIPFSTTTGELWSLYDQPYIWFLRQPEYFHRPGGPYQDPRGQDWRDNAERFAFLNRVAVEIVQGRVAELDGWRPDIVHLHDWQTGLVPYLLALEEKVGANRPATVFTIHNLAYQGRFAPEMLRRLHLPEEDFHPGGTELYGSFSFLKAGLVYADRLTTVSPRYAHEIQTPESGMGLDGLLRTRSGDLTGILNGIDTTIWNPGADPSLPAHFNSGSLTGKSACKTHLQSLLGLDTDHGMFLLGMISRLVEQKGCDLVLQLMPELMRRRIQMVILGTGDRHLEQWAQELAARYPGRMVAKIAFDECLSHQIEAGIDAFLMPSRFEPCGLNQMYSLRYGSPPIVHETGGLADTIQDAGDGSRDQGNGFIFRPATADALRNAIDRAESIFVQPEQWQRLQRRGMAEDYSWQQTAQQYITLYRSIFLNGSLEKY